MGHHPGDELSFGVETVDEHITEFCESGFHGILEFGGVDGQDLADSDDGDALLAVELHELIKGGQDIGKHLGRIQVDGSDLDASRHLPDLHGTDDAGALGHGEYPPVAVSGRDLGPFRTEVGIEEREHTDLGRRLGDRVERREFVGHDVHGGLSGTHQDLDGTDPVHCGDYLLVRNADEISDRHGGNGSVSADGLLDDLIAGILLGDLGFVAHIVVLCSPVLPVAEGTDDLERPVETHHGLLGTLLVHAGGCHQLPQCNTASAAFDPAQQFGILGLCGIHSEICVFRGILREHETDLSAAESAQQDLSVAAHLLPFVETEVLHPVEHINLAAGGYVKLEEVLYGIEAFTLGETVILDGLEIIDVALSGTQLLAVGGEHVLVVLGDQEPSLGHLAAGGEGLQGGVYGILRDVECEGSLLHGHRCETAEVPEDHGIHRCGIDTGGRGASGEVPAVVLGDAGTGDEVHGFQFPDRPEYDILGDLHLGMNIAQKRILGYQVVDLLIDLVEGTVADGGRGILRDLGFGHDVHFVKEDGTYLALADEIADPSVDGLLVGVAIGIDAPSALPEGLQGTGAHEQTGNVVLGRDPADLLPEVLSYLVGVELEVLDVVAESPLQDLSVKLFQECGTVLHENDVGESGQDDAVGEGRGGSVEGDRGDAHLTGLDQLQNHTGVVDIHVVFQDLPVGLLDDRLVLHVPEHLQQIGGTDLLTVDRDGAAHVVAEDHEAAGGGVSEAELEDL